MERFSQDKTINKATDFVVQKETEFVNKMEQRVNRGETYVAGGLEEEKKRLQEKGSFDHEEVFIGTGIYVTGRKVR